jgi:hypothetical protein
MPPTIKNFVSNSTEKMVNILITFPNGVLTNIEKNIDSTGINGIEKLLKHLIKYMARNW